MPDDRSVDEMTRELDRAWRPVCVDERLPVYTEKLRVEGGWLYRVMGIYDKSKGGNAIAICFVPHRREPPDWGSF